MDLDWIEIDDFPEITRGNKERQNRLERILKRLKSEYPTGLVWINTSLKNLQPVNNLYLNDIIYIIPWAFKKGLMSDRGYRKIILYYLNCFYEKKQISMQCVNVANYYQLISHNEIERITELRNPSDYSNFISVISIICFSFGKKFVDITDKDILDDHVDMALNSVVTSRNLIQKIRFSLGYTTKIKLTSHFKKSFVDKMIDEHLDFREIINDYQKYMVTSKYAKDTISAKNSFLSTFLEFLKDNSNTIKLVNFQKKNFWQYYDWLCLKPQYGNSSILNRILNAKLFIQWGLNIYPEFPEILDFPEEISKKLSRIAMEENENSDGYAFPIAGLAEKIIQVCYSFIPKNEREQLCRDFWLIVGSCPVRFDFVHNLSFDCLKPMINSNDFFGLTSEYRDKAGNIHGEFPIFDKIGIEAVQRLQQRCIDKGFKPITNLENGLIYIHLFQESNNSGILSATAIRSFLHENILSNIYDVKAYQQSNHGQLFEIGAHGFRHHIATVVQAKTRNTDATQFILGHRDKKMTMTYLRSQVSRNTLLYSLIDGYEKQELSGKFYLRLVEMWADDSIEDDRLFDVLTSEMELSHFLKQYGRKRDMGWCLTEVSCENYYRCWGCHHFLLRKEEIEEAIRILGRLFLNHRSLVKNSKEYTDENPIAADSIKKQALVQRRLTDLGMQPEMIWDMVRMELTGNDIKEALNDGKYKLTPQN